MALLSTEDVDENKSKSCIILEIGRYLCHNGIREFLYSRRPPSTRRQDDRLSYLLFVCAGLENKGLSPAFDNIFLYFKMLEIRKI